MAQPLGQGPSSTGRAGALLAALLRLDRDLRSIMAFSGARDQI
jgi:hypothetical protein